MVKTFRTFVMLCAVLSLSLPQVATAGQQSSNRSAGNQIARSIVQDVVLDKDRNLMIQIVDAQGKPHAGTPIAVRKAGKTVHQSVTGKDGRIVLAGFRPGVYEISSGPRGGIYRLWAPQTAPPRVTSGILLIDDQGIVRGSRGGWQKAAIVGGVIITSGVVGGVIGYNLKDAS